MPTFRYIWLNIYFHWTKFLYLLPPIFVLFAFFLDSTHKLYCENSNRENVVFHSFFFILLLSFVCVCVLSSYEFCIWRERKRKKWRKFVGLPFSSFHFHKVSCHVNAHIYQIWFILGSKIFIKRVSRKNVSEWQNKAKNTEVSYKNNRKIELKENKTILMWNACGVVGYTFVCYL